MVVYGLTDPRTGLIRYVGQTTADPKRRRHGHVMSALRKSERTRKEQWIYELNVFGLEPGVVVLEKCRTIGELDRAERKWIEEHGELNVMPGPTAPSPAEHGRRGGLALKGKPKSAEHRRKISENLTGRSYKDLGREPMSPEARAHASASAKARGFNHRPDCVCRFCENHRPREARRAVPTRRGVIT